MKEKEIPRVQLNSDLAYLIGIIQGDGTVYET